MHFSQGLALGWLLDIIKYNLKHPFLLKFIDTHISEAILQMPEQFLSCLYESTGRVIAVTMALALASALLKVFG